MAYTFVNEINFDPPFPPTAAPIAGPVQQFCLGAGGRVEWLRAIILPGHLGQGTATDNAVRAFAQGLGHANDDAGHIVANNLGGLGTVNWNIFPQQPNINRGAWKCYIERMIFEAVALYNVAVEVRYILLYAPLSPTPNRPFQILYKAVLPQLSPGGVPQWAPMIGDMVNP